MSLVCSQCIEFLERLVLHRVSPEVEKLLSPEHPPPLWQALGGVYHGPWKGTIAAWSWPKWTHFYDSQSESDIKVLSKNLQYFVYFTTVTDAYL